MPGETGPQAAKRKPKTLGEQLTETEAKLKEKEIQLDAAHLELANVKSELAANSEELKTRVEENRRGRYVTIAVIVIAAIFAGLFLYYFFAFAKNRVENKPGYPITALPTCPRLSTDRPQSGTFAHLGPIDQYNQVLRAGGYVPYPDEKVPGRFNWVCTRSGGIR